MKTTTPKWITEHEELFNEICTCEKHIDSKKDNCENCKKEWEYFSREILNQVVIP